MTNRLTLCTCIAYIIQFYINESRHSNVKHKFLFFTFVFCGEIFTFRLYADCLDVFVSPPGLLCTMRLLTAGISVWQFWLEQGRRSMSGTAPAVHLYTTLLHQLRSAGGICLHCSTYLLASIKYNGASALLMSGLFLRTDRPHASTHQNQEDGEKESFL